MDGCTSFLSLQRYRQAYGKTYGQANRQAHGQTRTHSHTHTQIDTRLHTRPRVQPHASKPRSQMSISSIDEALLDAAVSTSGSRRSYCILAVVCETMVRLHVRCKTASSASFSAS